VYTYTFVYDSIQRYVYVYTSIYIYIGISAVFARTKMPAWH
jgi:hypothetical protein